MLRYAFFFTHDVMLRYAFVTTARHDVMLRYAFVSTARHDVMLRYAFVTTARHDGRLRYAFVTTARHDVMLRYAFVSTHDVMLRYAFVTTVRHDVMLRYAFVTTARHDGRLRCAFVTTARHDVMLRYAFVTTARHDGRLLRYAWGGVGCDSIRHYCKTWCDATLRIRLYCKTWWEATLRYWKLMKKSIPDSIRSQVQGKRNGLLFKYIRSHQWRCEHTGFDLLTATGEAVRSLMRWREKATLIVRRVLKHKTDVFFFMVVSHMKSSWRHSETRIFKQSWAGARSAG